MDQAKDGAAERLAEVRKAMMRAKKRFDTSAAPCSLIAVSKTVPGSSLEPYLDAGQRVFGENRVQEAAEKWPALRTQYRDIELHLIGPLQTNKVRDAVVLFDCIQTVDRDKLAASLRAEMDRAGRSLKFFVQVNIGGEAQKHGIAPTEVVDFVGRCRTEHRLDIVGLMCIPPDGLPPGPYFASLVGLARQANVDELSMGMSGDFETAISMGATHVRVGSALFGARAPLG
ncbi:YggS family pyridoxal phosphate-dependent enzyme [Devosia rhodophyticola]|uniref:Pyridoxal phosphate homeostasis protein n=1 Tax=Devosia rhodophyticola TaxID=3026423 RepID=A0ABY7Z2G0_9HYPH|nr:YggS family pyridoxal phosphate-dependent enzyme [Devosia rhodophyticola]WDR07390.1 YggS family pyridoxal phosphate-dependent enzyme [Devosia rhodophyticola]